MDKKKIISLVVSVYNEEAALERFYAVTKKVLDDLSWNYEILFINDGSVDCSREIIDKIAATDKKVRAIHFSRNFGLS